MYSIGDTSFGIGVTGGGSDGGGGFKCRRALGSRCGAQRDQLRGCRASWGRKETG
jgi:hypothetical protein